MKVKEERERRVNRRATEAFRSALAKPKSLDQIYKTYLALTRQEESDSVPLAGVCPVARHVTPPT